MSKERITKMTGLSLMRSDTPAQESPTGEIHPTNASYGCIAPAIKSKLLWHFGETKSEWEDYGLTKALKAGGKFYGGALFKAHHHSHYNVENLLASYISDWPSMPADVILSTISNPEVAEAQNRALLENERLKTQLIAEKRAVLIAQQATTEATTRYNGLLAQNSKLLDGVCELTKCNRALQSAFISQNKGSVCLHETHRGVVSEVGVDHAEVTYETADGTLKQIYHRAQFVHKKLPAEGAEIEAHVIMVNVERSENPANEFISDIPSFSGKSISGSIDL